VVPPIKVGADGFGVELRVVVELHVVTQLEGVLEAVLAALPALGEERSGVGRARLGADQTLEDLAGDAEGLTVRGEGRVEELGLRRAGKDEGVPTVTVTAVALGASGERHGSGDEANCPQSYASSR